MLALATEPGGIRDRLWRAFMAFGHPLPGGLPRGGFQDEYHRLHGALTGAAGAGARETIAGMTEDEAARVAGRIVEPERGIRRALAPA